MAHLVELGVARQLSLQEVKGSIVNGCADHSDPSGHFHPIPILWHCPKLGSRKHPVGARIDNPKGIKLCRVITLKRQP